jgi:C4-dicarboxylate-specific signal transduction histidine kinase
MRCCVILNWSPHAEALMGWTRAEAVGRSVEELVFPEAQRPVHRQWVDRFLSEASGEAVGGRYETPLLHKDGHEILRRSVADGAAQRRGLHHQRLRQGHHRKRAAEEQLFQAQKMESVGQLTGGIAHDFNNMLTGHHGTIEILADGVKHDPALASIAKMIGDAADRASELTANLLALPKAAAASARDRRQCAGRGGGPAAVADARQADRDRRPRLSDQAWPALVDRSPAQLGAGQSRDQRPRRHADGGKAALQDREISRARA